MFPRICARLGFARMNSAYQERLKDERCFRVIGNLRANVFDPSSPFGSEKIEPETVRSGRLLPELLQLATDPAERLYLVAEADMVSSSR